MPSQRGATWRWSSFSHLTTWVLTGVLDDPLDFEFTEDFPETEGAGIWVEDIHIDCSFHFCRTSVRLVDRLMIVSPSCLSIRFKEIHGY